MKLEKLESAEITIDELDALLRGSLIKRVHFGDEALTLTGKCTMLTVKHDSTEVRNQP